MTPTSPSTSPTASPTASPTGSPIDAARDYLLREGRLLERRRFATEFEGAPADGVVDALLGYRNPDGGFGHGLEPDKRTPHSQPLDVQFALEALVHSGARSPELVHRGRIVPRRGRRPRRDGAARAAGRRRLPARPARERGIVPARDQPDRPARRPAARAGRRAPVARSRHRGVPRRARARRRAHRGPRDPRGRGAASSTCRTAPTPTRSVPHVADALTHATYFRRDADDPEYGVAPTELAPTPASPWRALFDDADFDAHLDRLARDQQPDGGWPINWPAVSDGDRDRVPQHPHPRRAARARGVRSPLSEPHRPPLRARRGAPGRAPRPVPGPELAARFEVSLRTVERDVQALLEAGVPIWTERGRDGGYCLDRAASLPPLNLTTPEATAVVIALAALGPGPFADAARAARRKIVAVLSPGSVDELEALTARMRVAPVQAPGRRIAARRRAGRGRAPRASSSSTTRTGTETARGARSRPTGSTSATATGPSSGWCRLRDDGRVFRLDRIRGLGRPANGRPTATSRRCWGGCPPSTWSPTSSGKCAARSAHRPRSCRDGDPDRGHRRRRGRTAERTGVPRDAARRAQPGAHPPRGSAPATRSRGATGPRTTATTWSAWCSSRRSPTR